MERPISDWRYLFLFLVISLIGLVSCSAEEPVATQYKKRSGETLSSTGTGSAQTSGNNTPSSSNAGDSIDADADEASDEEEANNDEIAAEAPPEDNAGDANQNNQAQVMLQMGTTIYNERCAGCHLALAQSQKLGRTADAILGAAALVPHNGVMWPNQAEATALAVALAP